MKEERGIYLNSHFANEMKIGDIGWFSKKNNASTGYMWKFRPDNSGVYEMIDEIFLHPSTRAAGAAGMIIWKFKAIREGKGSAKFELYKPAGKEPVETIVLEIAVSK